MRWGEPGSPEYAKRRENLEAPARVLEDGTEEDRLMRAEVLRELDRFEEAEEAPGGVTAQDFQWAVSQIPPLCRSRDVQVREPERGL